TPAAAAPPELRRLPRHQLLRFLERLLEANRQARPGSEARVAFVARSEALVRGVQHLLLRFGVVASVHSLRQNHRGASRTGHALAVGPATAHAVDVDPAGGLGVPVRALVGAGRSVPGRSTASTGADVSVDPPEEVGRPDVCWDEIVSITPAGRDQVYDLTVPGLEN